MATPPSTLATLPLRQEATIRSVGGDRAYRRRLLELGFLPGVPVRVLGVAPMGDPLDIEVRGCRFSLRHAEAAQIEVSAAAAVVATPEAAAAK
jgi:Fe2+ transport system protein FeoA